MLTDTQVNVAAQCLMRARADKVPLSGLPSGNRPETLQDAYRIQRAFDRMAGLPIAGYKIGAASAASQKLVGATEPFLATVYRPACLASPALLKRGDFFTPGVEAEFAFEIGADLPPRSGAYTREEVSAAVAAVFPIIEICDNRFVAWRVTDLLQIVADNGFFGALVVGRRMEAWREVNLAGLQVTMSVGGSIRATECCEAVLGDPLDGVVWIANELSKQGVGLTKGQLVPIGTWTGLYFIQQAESVEADFGPLGKVRISFDEL